MGWIRRLIWAVRSSSNTRHEQHSDLAPRGQNLRVVPSTADHLGCLDATVLGCAREYRAHVGVHRDGRLLLKGANRESELPLLGDRGAERANALLERTAAAEVGMPEVDREDHHARDDVDLSGFDGELADGRDGGFAEGFAIDSIACTIAAAPASASRRRSIGVVPAWSG